MADYIDRQAAIAYAISGRIRTLPTSEDGENWIRTAEVRQSLLNVPSAEVEPVKRGRWIDDGFYADYYGHHEYRCSECGECYIDYEMEWHYCPNCGAKLERSEEC